MIGYVLIYKKMIGYSPYVDDEVVNIPRISSRVIYDPKPPVM